MAQLQELAPPQGAGDKAQTSPPVLSPPVIAGQSAPQWAQGINFDFLNFEVDTLRIGPDYPGARSLQLFRMPDQSDTDTGYYIRLPQSPGSEDPPRYFFISGTRTFGGRIHYVPAHIVQNGQIQLLNSNAEQNLDLGLSSLEEEHILTFLENRWGEGSVAPLAQQSSGGPCLYSCPQHPPRFSGSFTAQELLRICLFDLQPEAPVQGVNVSGRFTRNGFSGRYILINHPENESLAVFYGGGITVSGGACPRQYFAADTWSVRPNADLTWNLNHRINRTVSGAPASNSAAAPPDLSQLVVPPPPGGQPAAQPVVPAPGQNTPGGTANNPAPSPTIAGAGLAQPLIQEYRSNYQTGVSAVMQHLLANTDNSGIAVANNQTTGVFGRQAQCFGMLVNPCGWEATALYSGGSTTFSDRHTVELAGNLPSIPHWRTASDGISEADAAAENARIFPPIQYMQGSMRFWIFAAPPAGEGPPRLFITRETNMFNSAPFVACCRSLFPSADPASGATAFEPAGANGWNRLQSLSSSEGIMRAVNLCLGSTPGANYSYFYRLRQDGSLEMYRTTENTQPSSSQSGHCIWRPQDAISGSAVYNSREPRFDQLP